MRHQVDWSKEKTSYATFKSFTNSGTTLYVYLHEQSDPIKCTSGHKGDFQRAAESVSSLIDGDPIKYQSRGVEKYSPNEWFYRIEKNNTESPDSQSAQIEIKEDKKEQQPAFKPEEKSSQKVYGPPGTGKTTKMMAIIKQRLADGVLPNEICFISYTNVAANEAIDRALREFPDFSKTDFPFFKTIHALATALGGLDGKKVMSPEDMRSFDKTILLTPVWTEKGKSQSIKVRSNHPCLTIRSLASARKTSYEEQIKTVGAESLMQSISKSFIDNGWGCPEFKTTVSAMYYWMDAYDKYKQQNYFLDYDDVIHKVLQSDFDLSKLRFKLLIIDEAQDCSDFMWDFLKLLIKESKEVYIAGDDDQAIMDGFGANSQAFLEIKTSKEDDVLSKSYRLCEAHHRRLISEYGPLSVLKKFKPLRKEKDFTHNGNKEGTITTEITYSDKTSAPLTLENLLRLIQLNPKEEWLVMAPTKKTVDEISIALLDKNIAHFKNNQPQYIGNSLELQDIRVQTIHTSKGAEADNVGIVVLSKGDVAMYSDPTKDIFNPSLSYVAESRSKKNMYFAFC